DKLVGSPLGSILIGGAGNDILTGAGGQNLLIGGTGSDTLTAGPGGDILIAGFTNYDGSNDANRLALAAIMTEWRSGDTYLNRTKALIQGVGPNQKYKLDGITVHDDNAVDSLTSGAGLDWYFVHIGQGQDDKYQPQNGELPYYI